MIKYLKKAFRSIIIKEDWLEESKKREVIEKVTRIHKAARFITQHLILAQLNGKQSRLSYVH